MKGKELSEFKKQVREAVANYMRSEGCSCCRDYEAHKEHTKVLAKLLGVKAHPEQDDFFDFSKYTSKK